MKNDSTKTMGSLHISRSVIASIASTAAREVEGVSSIPSQNIKDVFQRRQIVRPVNINLSDGVAVIDLRVVLKNTARIPTVSKKIQASVKESVQSMTGIAVSKVNVIIAGIAF